MNPASKVGGARMEKRWMFIAAVSILAVLGSDNFIRAPIFAAMEL